MSSSCGFPALDIIIIRRSGGGGDGGGTPINGLDLTFTGALLLLSGLFSVLNLGLMSFAYNLSIIKVIANGSDNTDEVGECGMQKNHSAEETRQPAALHSDSNVLNKNAVFFGKSSGRITPKPTLFLDCRLKNSRRRVLIKQQRAP
jgi:hypothetical protein